MTGAAAPPVPQVPLAAQFLELTNGVLVTRMVEVLMRYRIAEHMQTARRTPMSSLLRRAFPNAACTGCFGRRRDSAS